MTRSLSPIVSRKHILQDTIFTVAAGAKTAKWHAIAVAAPTADYEVKEGSIIKAIYIEYWVTSDDATQGSIVLSVEKIPGGNITMSYAESIALNDYSNKKNIFYVTQGITNPLTGGSLPFIRQWVKIPKGKQRMGLGDILSINISGITNGANICGLAIYKEYQ